MKNILLCSSNPLLTKNLYALLRDEGFSVVVTEHPAFTVQLIIKEPFDFLIIDSEPFGLSAEDAVQIIRNIAPGLQVLFVGGEHGPDAGNAVDLEEFKRTLQSMTAVPAASDFQTHDSIPRREML